MRQQILENQVRDLRKIIDELLDELDTMSCFVDEKQLSIIKPDETIKALRARADEVVAR